MLLNVFMYLEQACPCCDMNVENDVIHIVFVCPCNDDSRIVLWEKSKRLSGPMFHNMSIMALEDITNFLLNAFYFEMHTSIYVAFEYE
jgi:hypothetical protein